VGIPNNFEENDFQRKLSRQKLLHLEGDIQW